MATRSKAVLFLALLLPLLLKATEPLCQRSQMLMGTFASISLPCDQMHYAQGAFEILKDVEHALSDYNPQALLYQLNHKGHIVADAYLLEALRLSRRYYKESGGAFDITVGSITRGLYHFGEQEQIPSKQALQEANLNMQAISFDGPKVHLKENILLDLGGMGKGYGVDKAIAYLKAQGMSRAVVALSGDIRCLHRCKLGILDPFSSQVLFYFRMKNRDMGISTSGNYRRFVKDSQHNHLINPKTKVSQQTFASITLIASLPNADLDAYATAASVMSFQNALKFLKAKDLEYYLITTDHKHFSSTDFFKEVNLIQ